MEIKYKETAIFYVSKVTGKKYSVEDYTNHGKGGFYKGFNDLPADEYPYSIEYKKEKLYKWQ